MGDRRKRNSFRKGKRKRYSKRRYTKRKPIHQKQLCLVRRKNPSEIAKMPERNTMPLAVRHLTSHSFDVSKENAKRSFMYTFLFFQVDILQEGEETCIMHFRTICEVQQFPFLLAHAMENNIVEIKGAKFLDRGDGFFDLLLNIPNTKTQFMDFLLANGFHLHNFEPHVCRNKILEPVL